MPISANCPPLATSDQPFIALRLQAKLSLQSREIAAKENSRKVNFPCGDFSLRTLLKAGTELKRVFLWPDAVRQNSQKEDRQCQRNEPETEESHPAIMEEYRDYPRRVFSGKLEKSYYSFGN
jgi:hypothetical protein